MIMTITRPRASTAASIPPDKLAQQVLMGGFSSDQARGDLQPQVYPCTNALYLGEENMTRHKYRTIIAASALAVALTLCAGGRAAAETAPGGAVAPFTLSGNDVLKRIPTATPIKHPVVIYDENVSFDHYFATYPTAANPLRKVLGFGFTAASNTPKVNNLVNADLLTNNPNFTNLANGKDAANPFRLDRTQAFTMTQEHNYTPEQQAYDGGKMDLFPKYVGRGNPPGMGIFVTNDLTMGYHDVANGLTMGYYDGNTVTALWNYAQHFVMNDNAFGDTYGPSSLGALEVVSGQTNGMQIVAEEKATTHEPYYIDDGQGGVTMINDVDPAYDVCSKPSDQAMMTSKNIGDLLNEAGITWGGFMGGFNLKIRNPNGTTGCKRSTASLITGFPIVDYWPHHNWFQYCTSTANPTHARPRALIEIGYSFDHEGKRDPANHEYDLEDFYDAVEAGNFPAVAYIKLSAYQDGHAAYSDPLDEQIGVVTLINFLEQQPDWKNTAVIVTWDDSDGWYDHAFVKPTNPSFDKAADQLDGPGRCGTGTPPSGMAGKPVNGRCGPGPRIPFLAISPWAKTNYVSHTQISQASVVRFIEDNWLHGERLAGGSFDATSGSIMDMFDLTSGGHNPPLFLNPTTGAPNSRNAAEE
jgi:phospholipase C